MAGQPSALVEAEEGLLGEAGDLLEVLAIALESGCKLSILLLQVSKLALGRVLLLFDRFEFVLGSLHLLLDVCEEQVLVERVDVTDRLVFHKGGRLTRFVVCG